MEKKEGTKDEYVRVMPPDQTLIGNAIHQVKGMETITDFAFDCGYASYRHFYSLISGRNKRAISEELADTILDAGSEKCISKDQLMAANGQIRVSFMRAIQLKMLESSDEKVISYEDTVNSAETESRKYLDFLDMVSEFASELDSGTQMKLSKGVNAFYKLDDADKMLRDYCSIKKDTASSEAYLALDSHEFKDIPREVGLCHDYELVFADLMANDSVRVKPEFN